MRTHLRFVSSFVLYCAVTGASAGQDGEPVRGGKAAKEAAAANSTPEHLRLVLRDAASAVKSLEKKDKQGDGLELELPDFEWSNLEEPRAEALLAIGAAQAQVGDVAAARKTWQDALDLASGIHDFAGSRSKAVLITRIAKAQSEAGDQEEALATLQQALQASRLMRDPAGRLRIPSFLATDSDPAVARVKTLKAIAEVQRAAGDARGARKTFEQAHEAAGTVKNPVLKSYAQAEVAHADDPSGGLEPWARATRDALAVEDAFLKARCVEVVVRALAGIGRTDQALRLVNEHLKGDLSAFAVAAIADELAGGKKPVTAAVVQSLQKCAEGVPYDHRSKRATVFAQVALLQARAGELDAANKAIDAINPKKAGWQTSVLTGKLNVLEEIARHHLKAGRKNEAKDAVQTALESVAPFQGEDGEIWFPVQDLLELLARAGDPINALGLARNIRDPHSRMNAMLAIAGAQREAGDRDGARTTIDEAARAVDGIPNHALWSGLGMRRMFPRLGKNAPVSDFDMSVQFSLQPGPKYSALKDIAVARAKLGDVAQAMETAKSIPDEEGALGSRTERQAALGEIATVQAKAGDAAAALATFAMLPEKDERFSFGTAKVDVITAIVQAQVKAGRAREVLEWGEKRSAPKTKLSVWQALAEAIAPKPAADHDGAADAQP